MLKPETYRKEIKDSGILTFLLDCTGYGEGVMIRSVTSHTQKDIIPHLNLPFDCCETGGNKIHLDKLHLDN
jgi:hypothetical protein